MAHPLTDTAVGARLDRAPWQRLHTTILLALGAGWLFDSFEVQIFSSAIGPLGDHFHASVFQRDAVLAVWLGGILLGAVTGDPCLAQHRRRDRGGRLLRVGHGVLAGRGRGDGHLHLAGWCRGGPTVPGRPRPAAYRSRPARGRVSTRAATGDTRCG